MKKLVGFLIAGIVLLLYIGFGVVNSQNQKKKQDAEALAKSTYTVKKGEIVRNVVETGTIDAVKAVDVRSRASGRLLRMLVEEGAMVKKGQLIAVIDPQETQLQYEQNAALLSGAKSSVTRQGIEIEQRRISANAAYDSAKLRLAQLQNDAKTQPKLTTQAIESAKSALMTAEQSLAQLQRSTHPNARTEAQRSVSDATIAYETSVREYDRIVNLEKNGYVPGRQLDQSRQEVQIAKNRLDAAKAQFARLDEQLKLEEANAKESVRRARLDLDRAELNSIQDDNKRKEVSQAMNEVERSRAALRDVDALMQARMESQSNVTRLGSVLKDSQRQLSETQIIAPMDGIVAKRYLEIGDLVTGLSGFSQGTAICRIEDRNAMRVRLEINEIDTARLKLGLATKITVDALPETTYSGVVKKIAPASTSLTSGTNAPVSSDNVVKYQVEVWLSSVDDQLRSGMSAKCSMEVLKESDILIVPVDYVGKEEGSSFVMLKSGSKSTKTTVRTGVSSGAYIQILEGVKEGDKIQKPKFTGPPRSGFMQGGGN